MLPLSHTHFTVMSTFCVPATKLSDDFTQSWKQQSLMSPCHRRGKRGSERLGEAEELTATAS